MGSSEDAKKLTALFQKILTHADRSARHTIESDIAQFEIAPDPETKKIFAFALIDHAENLVRFNATAALATLQYITNKSEADAIQIQRSLSLGTQWIKNRTISADHGLGFVMLLESRKIRALPEYADLCRTAIARIDETWGFIEDKIAVLNIVRHGFNDQQPEILALIDDKIAEMRTMPPVTPPVTLRPCG